MFQDEDNEVMTAPHPLGTVVGAGFILMSTRRREGQMLVKCPVCRNRVWRHQSNVMKVKSCGCAHSRGISLTKRLERHRATVEAARVAFATDTAYGIAMAREANRISERRSDASSTL